MCSYPCLFDAINNKQFIDFLIGKWKWMLYIAKSMNGGGGRGEDLIKARVHGENNIWAFTCFFCTLPYGHHFKNYNHELPCCFWNVLLMTFENKSTSWPSWCTCHNNEFNYTIPYSLIWDYLNLNYHLNHTQKLVNHYWRILISKILRHWWASYLNRLVEFILLLLLLFRKYTSTITCNHKCKRSMNFI